MVFYSRIFILQLIQPKNKNNVEVSKQTTPAYIIGKPSVHKTLNFEGNVSDLSDLQSSLPETKPNLGSLENSSGICLKSFSSTISKSLNVAFSTFPYTNNVVNIPVPAEIGIFVNELLNQAIGGIGTSLLLLTAVVLYLVLTFDITSEKLSSFIEKIKPKKNEETQEEEVTTVFNEQTTAPVLEETTIETISETTEPIANPLEPTLVTPQVEPQKEEEKEELGMEVSAGETEEILSKTEIEKKLEELGNKGLDYVIKNHDWDILADSLLKKFENLVDSKK